MLFSVLCLFVTLAIEYRFVDLQQLQQFMQSADIQIFAFFVVTILGPVKIMCVRKLIVVAKTPKLSKMLQAPAHFFIVFRLILID